MARIVELHDHGPLIVKRSEMAGEAFAVCRCGLSAKWPNCDGSHAQTNDEGNGPLRAYTRGEDGRLAWAPVKGVAKGEADPRGGSGERT